VPENVRAADIIDRIESFSFQKDDIEAAVKNFGDLDAVRTDFTDLSERLDSAAVEYERRRILSSWDLRMSSEFKAGLKPLFDDVAKVKSDYLDFLKSTDGRIAELEEAREVFQKALDKIAADPSLAAQRPAVQDAVTELYRYQSRIRKTRQDYTALYRSQSAILERAEALRKSLSAEIRFFRRAYWTKTDPTFFEKEFADGFKTPLGDELNLMWHDFTVVDWERVRGDAGKAWYFIVVCAGLFLAFRRLRRVEGWGQVFRQPAGLSLTLTTVLSAFWVEQPVLPLVVAFWAILGLLIPVTVRAYPLSAKQRRDIDVLVLCFVALQIIGAVGFPLVLYRLLLVTVALVILAYCRRRLFQLYALAEPNRVLRIFFRILILFVTAAAVAETLGYHILAASLIHGAVKSSFLIFVVWNLRFVFVNFVLGFFQSVFERARLGRGDRVVIARKVTQIFHALLAASVVAALAVIWGVYDGVWVAFSGILQLGGTLHGRSWTIGMFVNAAAFLYVVVAAAQVICALLEEELYPRNNIGSGTGKSINTLVMYAAWVVGTALAVTALGFELRQFAIIAGALSVGIGFGLQNIVSNFVSGLILLFERPIKIGDVLNVEGQWGTVEKMGLRSTVIRSGTKAEIIIPNSDFVTRKVENLTFSDLDHRLSVKVGVAYGSDTERVAAILIEIASTHPSVVKEPKPEAYFMEFGDNALQFELFAWTQELDFRRKIISDLLFEIERRFRAEGIEIPFPRRDLHLRSVDRDVLAALKE
jgi:small-conductance mechanosensitive channel